MNEEILREVAVKLNVPYETVEKVMKTFFNFIRFKISKVKYRELLTFNKIKTNFSVPGFGKLVVKNKSDKRLEYARKRAES